MVYILLFNDEAIIVGKGKRNRAKVVFDDVNKNPTTHYKAVVVRLYGLYEADGNFERYIIECDSDAEAKEIEHSLHQSIGGDGIKLTQRIKDNIWEGISENSAIDLAIKMALVSSYDALYDLKNWRRCGLLDNVIWDKISKIFNLSENIDLEKQNSLETRLFN